MHYMFDINFKAQKIVLTTFMSSFLIQQKTVNYILEISWHKGNQHLSYLYCTGTIKWVGGVFLILWEIAVLYQTITNRIFSLDE